MNERLQDLLDSVQRTAGQVGDAAADAAYGVGKKAVELVSVAKMNIQLVELRSEINTGLREVGEMMYATHTGDPTDSETLLAKLAEIDDLNARVEAITAQISREKAATVCPVCGAPIHQGDVFCRECGGKLV